MDTPTRPGETLVNRQTTDITTTVTPAGEHTPATVLVIITLPSNGQKVTLGATGPHPDLGRGPYVTWHVNGSASPDDAVAIATGIAMAAAQAKNLDPPLIISSDLPTER